MERVESLIHKLSQQLAVRASAADLLVTTELLYKELARQTSLNTLASVGTVAVWLPRGFLGATAKDISWAGTQSAGAAVYSAPPAPVSPIPVPAAVAHQPPASEVVVAKPATTPQMRQPVVPAVIKDLPAPPVDEGSEVVPAPAKAGEVAAPVIAPAPTAPAPAQAAPSEAAASPLPVQPPIASVAGPAQHEGDDGLVFHLEVEPSEEELAELESARQKQREEQAALAKKALEEAYEKSLSEQAADRVAAQAPVPAVPPQQKVEEKITQEAPKLTPTDFNVPTTAKTKPFPAYPDLDEVIRITRPMVPQTPRQDINQLVADPNAPMLNERLQAKNRELADVLASSGGKVADLRKAFTINEKYQLISSLFRGDEDMFERSLKTLNNFGTLPEAQFWLQRELVVKMGWNEEDELAQLFYRMLSRRFL